MAGAGGEGCEGLAQRGVESMKVGAELATVSARLDQFKCKGGSRA